MLQSRNWLKPLIFFQVAERLKDAFGSDQKLIHEIKSTKKYNIAPRDLAEEFKYISSVDSLAEEIKVICDNETEAKTIPNLSNAMEEFRTHPTPFIFIEGSSGMGKTQMAFNLRAAGVKLVYFLASESQGQRIYKYHANISDAFIGSIRKDLDTLNVDSKRRFNASVDNFRSIGEDVSLYSFGFIKAMITQQTSFKPITKKELIGYLNNNPDSRNCVFFVDEFPFEVSIDRTNSNATELRFYRNIFRYFQLILIIAATNSTAKNLFLNTKCSREGEQAYKFCYIVTELPKFYLQKDCDEMTKYILKNSRPLFSRLFLESDSTSLEERLSFVSKQAHILKVGNSGNRNLYYIHGQACLIFGNLADDFKIEDTALVHNHFANLKEENEF